MGFQKHQILIGFGIWLLWILAKLPHPLDADWGRGILLLAPLVVVPLAMDVLARTAPFSSSKILRSTQNWQLPAAAAFALAFSMENGWVAVLLALPWVAVLSALAWVGLQQIIQGAWRNAATFSLSAGMAYLSVAGVWAVMERAGFYPFGFNPEIVFLTIVHFHYAGFILPLLAGLAAVQLGNRLLHQITCYFAIAAVGLLAVGITFTQRGLGTDWELASAWLMALTAVSVGMMHLRLAFMKNNPLKIRWLWAVSGMALLGGMLLAGLYGSRFIAPVAWLDIAMMRALHGSLNAVGFGLCGVLGHWYRPASKGH
jgi:YndJ-like protein